LDHRPGVGQWQDYWASITSNADGSPVTNHGEPDTRTEQRSAEVPKAYYCEDQYDESKDDE
jgi:hypothetical protein